MPRVAPTMLLHRLRKPWRSTLWLRKMRNPEKQHPTRPRTVMYPSDFPKVLRRLGFILRSDHFYGLAKQQPWSAATLRPLQSHH